MKEELKEAARVAALPVAASVSGTLVGALFGATAGLVSGFGLFWLAAVVASAAERTEPLDEAEKWKAANPNRPRGIRIASTCSCDECCAKRATA